MKHDAFISYSHAADGKLAPALQQGLEQFAKPWHRMRALKVFRDQTNLSASPHLWQSIVDELSQARWFLLMASPEAAASKWVAREVQWWLEHRDPHHLLILLTGGDLRWDEAAVPPDFDREHSTAVHACLRRVFREEPLFIDLRSMQRETGLTLKHTAFRAAVLMIAAPLHGRSPDEMDGEAVRAHARNRRWAGAAMASLAALAVVASWQAYAATRARDIALSRQLAAQSTAILDRSVDTAMLLAVQAWRTSPTPEARSAMLRGLQLGPIRRFLPGHASPIVGLALDRQAQWAIVASEAGDVTRVRLDGSAPDWTYRSDTPIERMALSPDGAELAIGLRDGRVQLLAPGRPAAPRVVAAHTRRVTALAFAPDGQRGASGGLDGGIAVWDVATGAPLGGLPEVFNSHPTDSLAFSADGTSVYAALGLEIVVWNTIARRQEGAVGNAKGVSANELTVVPGAAALTGIVWQDKEWRLLRWPTSPTGGPPVAIPAKAAGIHRLAYNADGRVLALGTNTGHVVFHVAGTEASFRAHNGEVRAVAISADGRYVVSGGKDGRVILWDREARPLHSGTLGPASRGLAPLAASPGRCLLVSGNSSGQLLWVSPGASAPVLRVGPEVAAGGESRSRARGIVAVAFSPDGRQVAVGLADGSVVLQPVDGTPPVHRARDWGAGYPVGALAFSPDGRTLVSAHYDGSVVTRDAKTAAPRGEPANIVNDSADHIRALSFSADGRRLLVHAYRRGVLVRDMASLAKASRATIESAKAHTAGPASAVTFSVVARASPDGPWAWASNVGEVQLRRSDDTPADGAVLRAEGGLEIRSVAFSPDRATLAASGSDERILLWDLRERRPVDEPLRGTRAGTSLAYTHDGRFLVTRGTDGELGWWSPDGHAWAAMLCAIVNRRFTDREWLSYIGSDRRDNDACDPGRP